MLVNDKARQSSERSLQHLYSNKNNKNNNNQKHMSPSLELNNQKYI